MKKIILISFLFIFSPSHSFANTNLMANALENFKLGNYIESLNTLGKVRGGKKIMGAKYYLEGVSLNRLQRYDEAELKLSASLSAGHRAEDLYYEYGQSLYANNKLEEAREVFNKSARSGYKKHTSFYYIAHISQILEDWKLARSYYQKITKSKNVETNLLQIAHFQLGEVLLSIAEIKKNNSRNLVAKYVLPRMDQAISSDRNSLLAKEITTRRDEIQKRYDLDPTLYKNGRPIPARNWEFSFSQEFRYDNNITLATDLPSVQATQKDSNIFEMTVQSSFNKAFARRWTFTPDLRFSYLIHQDRDASEVFQNDQYKISPAVRSAVQHTLFGNPAALILDWDWDYIARDKLGDKNVSFYSRAATYTLGERFKLFGQGETTFKVKLKNYEGYQDSLDTTTTSFTADHILILPASTIMVLFFSYDKIDAVTDSSDQSSILGRIDYIIPGIANQYILNGAMSANFIKKDLAGTNDITLSPSVKLSKKITKKSKLNISYTYTQNLSDTTANEYSKHVTGIEYKFIF